MADGLRIMAWRYYRPRVLGAAETNVIVQHLVNQVQVFTRMYQCVSFEFFQIFQVFVCKTSESGYKPFQMLHII